MISFEGMGRFSLVAAFLTLLLMLAGCGGMGVPYIPGEPTPGVQNQQPMKTWAPTPAPPTETAASDYSYPVPDPTDTYSPPQTGTTYAAFEHFNVQVTGTAGRPDFFAVQAEVCVVKAVNSKGTRISTAPWTVTTNEGKVTKADTDPEFSEANFPQSGLYDEQECARGWLHFKTDGMDIREIGYANSLGNQALWDGGGIRI